MLGSQNLITPPGSHYLVKFKQYLSDFSDCNDSVRCGDFGLIFYLVDEGWNLWKDSTHCSHSCGGGYKLQNRSCTNPLPTCGGVDCVGTVDRTVPCNKQCCPGKTCLLYREKLK